MKLRKIVSEAATVAIAALVVAVAGQGAFAPVAHASASWTFTEVGNFTSGGKSDIAQFDSSTGSWWVRTSTGSGFNNSVWTTWSPSVHWVDVQVGDFNGDGFADIAGRDSSTGNWWVSLSNGSGFTTSLWGAWSSSVTWVDVHVGDFNGDGKADIAGRVKSTGQWYVALSNGSAFSSSVWDTWSPSVTWVDVRTGDFNGDGRTDIAGRDAATGGWYVATSNGTGFNNTLWGTWSPSVTWTDVQVGDFNGDGRSDLAGRDAGNGNWWVASSTGTAFATTLWGAWSTSVTWVDVHSGAFVGDGRSGIAGRISSSGQWWVAVSNGTAFANSLWTTWSSSVTWSAVSLGDFNGDGRADIAGFIASKGQWWVALSSGTAFSNSLWTTTGGSRPPAFSLSVQVGSPTATVTGRGSNFPTGDQVNVTFDGNQVATAIPGSTGTFSVNFRVPASAAPGAHLIGAFDTEGQGTNRTFLVRTDWASARFSPTGTGFNPFENVLSPANVSGLVQKVAITGNLIASPPTYSGGMIYAAGGDGGTILAYGGDGRPAWSFSTGGPVMGSPLAVIRKAGAPACAIVDGSADGNVYGLNPATGGQLWAFPAGASVSTSPVVALPASKTQVDPEVVFATANGGIDELDGCSGAIRWSDTPNGLVPSPGEPPAIGGGIKLPDGTTHTIIVVCFPGRVEAVDAGTGGGIWTNTNIGAGAVGAPSVYGSGTGGGILITSGTQVEEMKAATGSVVWKHDTGSSIGGGIALVGTFGLGGGLPTEVVVGNDAGIVVALDPVVGTVKWSSATGAPTRSYPVAANGVVYLTADPSPGAGGQVLALNATTGAILFRGDDGTSPAGTTQSPSVIVVDAHIYAGGYGGGLRFFSLP
jgi:outer membrane protein assembly factor BamB